MRKSWCRPLLLVLVIGLLVGSSPVNAGFHPIDPPVRVPKRPLATVAFTAPGLGTLLPADEHVEVVWTYSGALVGGFILQYEWEAQPGFRFPVATPNPCIAVPTKHYSWRVPAGAGRIRLHIRAVTGCEGSRPAVASASSVWYDVPVPMVTLSQPNGGGTYVPGVTYPIRWRMAPGQAPLVNIHYSWNDGGTWLALATNLPNDGSYDWRVPADAYPTTQGRIRVEALLAYPGTEFPAVVSSAVSDPFNVTIGGTPGVVLVHPDPPAPGELVFAPGDSTIIRWVAPGGMFSWGLELSLNGGGSWSQIGCSPGTYRNAAWTVPAVATEAGKVRVRGYTAVDCMGGVGARDESTHPFAIRAAPGNRAPEVTSSGGFPPEPGQLSSVSVWATDPDGDSLDFRWEQVAGPAATELSGADTNSLQFRAPEVFHPVDIVWEVTVSDAPTRGAAALRTTLRIVQRVAARAPRVENVTADCGGVGTRVIVNGENLRGVEVFFNGRRAFNDTRGLTETLQNYRIITYVPAGATSGPLTLVGGGHEVTAVDTFTVVPLVIDQVRITQGLTEYPLVWGKQTLVQVFPRSGTLAACRAEVSGGTLTIGGGAGGVFNPQVGTGGVVLQPLPVRPRTRIEDGVHFQVPAAHLQFPLADFGGFTITLTHNREPAASVTVPRSAVPAFHDLTGSPGTLLVGIRQRGMAADPDWSANKLAGQLAYLRMMPVPGNWRQTFPGDGRFFLYTDTPPSPDNDRLRSLSGPLEDFRRAWNEYHSNKARVVAGLIDEASAGGGGIAWQGGHQSLTVNHSAMGRTLAHEVGHNYGLVDGSAPNHASWNAGHSKYDEGTDCQSALTFGQSLVDQLGRTTTVINIASLDQFPSSPGAPCDQQAKSVMSYAPDRNHSNSFFEFIDYLHLLRQAGGVVSAGSREAAPLQVAGETLPSLQDTPPPPGDNPGPGKWDLIIHGSIAPSGKAVTVDASRLVAPGAADPPALQSPYHLTFLDSNGKLLRSHPFPATFTVPGGHHKHDGSGRFSVRTPFPDGTATVEVRHGQEMLLPLTVSANAPEVKVTNPAPGSQFTSEDTIQLKWAAADPDGDRLRFIARISADKGATWAPVAVMLSENALEMPVQDLPGGEVWLRVDASDNFHVGSGVVQPLFLPDKPPRVALLKPGSGARFFVNQAVELSAVALDLEDGPITGKDVTWRSSLDGVLGNGEYLTVDRLSPGEHAIDVTVVDSAGQTVTAGTVVSVVDKEMPVHRPDVKGGPEDGAGEAAPGKQQTP